jgi:mono/diheme cytochrome c family protein
MAPENPGPIGATDLKRRMSMLGEILKKGALLLLLLSALLVLAACGTDAASTSVPTSAPMTEPPTQASTEAPTITEPTAAPADANPFPPEMPSAVRGMVVYEANCTTCHGAAGDGSGLPGAADFTDLMFVRGKTPAEFFQSIRDGVEGRAMPAWGGQLGEMEMWDVLYYEWTFATSPDQTAEGEMLFNENCVSCHGAAGDGSGLPGAANFTDQQFVANRNPDKFFQSITGGVDGTAMPAWGETFTEDQIWALVNYVWTFAYEYPGGTTSGGATAEPTAETALPQEPDPAIGAQLWAQKPCSGCHGAQAMGDIGPRLAGTVLQFDEVLLRVRAGKGDMPAFSEAEISDLELRHIYAWLESLTPPTPTLAPTDTPEPNAPTSTPRAELPPSGHLMAFWEDVNWVKVHSDFAKDATPTIEALHDRVRQARDRGNDALQEADLAIAEIPDQQANATIREVKGYINEILQHADAASNTDSLDAARAEAAKMVEISRLDAWPSASLAVKQAGFTGSVQVRVRDQSGNPIAGALVTALTAPSPAAGITGGDGRVIINDLAAVRVMQVKAYQDGLVYHEVHVTVPTGGRAEADITLPGPSVGGQTPAISNVSLTPSSGPGNAQVTFRMTGTDPQGHANIAEDQVFALNPDLGVAYVLRSAGGDNWETTVGLPDLPAGTHTWYFFIVDHQCNTSNVVTRTYTVQ